MIYKINCEAFWCTDKCTT